MSTVSEIVIPLVDENEEEMVQEVLDKQEYLSGKEMTEDEMNFFFKSIFIHALAIYKVVHAQILFDSEDSNGNEILDLWEFYENNKRDMILKSLHDIENATGFVAEQNLTSCE